MKIEVEISAPLKKMVNVQTRGGGIELTHQATAGVADNPTLRKKLETIVRNIHRR